jgi:hypothetical protein
MRWSGGHPPGEPDAGGEQQGERRASRGELKGISGYERCYAVRDPSTLPRRDEKGRFLEPPSWLRPGWKHLHEAGYRVGGHRQRHCARESCGDIALRHSDYCRHHDVDHRRKRLEQLRRGTGKPPTPAELTRLFRANAKALWAKSPWQPLLTLWLSPALEADFVEACRRGGLDQAEIAPVVSNTLRWVWKRSVLDRDDDEGWQRALAAVRKHQARIGEPPEGYEYSPPSAEPPDDPRIKQILRRATATELAAQTGPIDRTTKAKARRRRSRERQAPAKFDAPEFIGEHWASTFAPVFKSLRLEPDDIDGPIGHQLAVAWRAVLDEEAKLGDQSYGPARKRWHALLRELQP